MCPFPCQTNMQNRQDLWLIWISALISQSCWLKTGAVLKWGKDVVFFIGGGGTEVGRQLVRIFFEHFEKSRKCSTAAGLWWVRESRRRIGLYLKILRTTCDRNLIVVHTDNQIHNTCAYWCIQEDHDLFRWWMPDQFRNSNIALLSYELPFLKGIELSRVYYKWNWHERPSSGSPDLETLLLNNPVALCTLLYELYYIIVY